MTSGSTRSASVPTRSGPRSAVTPSATRRSGGSASSSPQRRDPSASWPRPGHRAESRAARCRFDRSGRWMGGTSRVGWAWGSPSSAAADRQTRHSQRPSIRCRNAPGGIVVGPRKAAPSNRFRGDRERSAASHDVSDGSRPVRSRHPSAPTSTRLASAGSCGRGGSRSLDHRSPRGRPVRERPAREGRSGRWRARRPIRPAPELERRSPRPSPGRRPRTPRRDRRGDAAWCRVGGRRRGHLLDPWRAWIRGPPCLARGVADRPHPGDQDRRPGSAGDARSARSQGSAGPRDREVTRLERRDGRKAAGDP
jgi:hypothetical protein